MNASVIYWTLRRLVELLVLRHRSDDGKEVEILVLRHELMVLRRQVARPRCTLADRVVLSALAQVLSRDRRGSLFVRPETVRRWHRALIARRWTYRRATIGRPRTCASRPYGLWGRGWRGVRPGPHCGSRGFVWPEMGSG